MAVYRLADVCVRYTPHSDYVAALLTDYEAAGDPALLLDISEADIDAEARYLPCASHGVREAAALLRTLADALPSLSRLAVHAASVIHNGKALAFVAPSGVGKTTHARLWEERSDAFVLNGDRVLLHIENTAVTAFGNPWRGKEHLGRNADAPLRALFFLEHGETSRLEPLTAIEALPLLLRAVPLPAESAARLQILTLLDRLTALVPLYRLYATPSADAVDAVLNTLRRDEL